MEKQQTVVNSAVYSGIALHSGARSAVRVQPAPENTGIVFRRVDLPGRPEVRALASNVVDVRRGTTIASGNAVVFTVEHIMSALNAFHIDNCIVEMDGMEPPIGDGSSLPYCRMLREAGVQVQEAEAKVFTPASPLYVEGGHTRLVIVPGPELRIACTTSFPGCPIDPQFYEFTATTPDAYETEIAGGPRSSTTARSSARRRCVTRTRSSATRFSISSETFTSPAAGLPARSSQSSRGIRKMSSLPGCCRKRSWLQTMLNE